MVLQFHRINQIMSNTTTESQPLNRYVSIDEEGFPHLELKRIADPALGKEVLQNIRKDETNAFITTVGGVQAYVEAFDQPFVLQQVEKQQGTLWQGLLPYGVTIVFDVTKLTLDDWDRFIGVSEPNAIPFVMSRKAQAEFFNLVDDFDDDTIIVDNKRFNTPYWLDAPTEAFAAQDWSHRYQVEDMPWDLNAPAQALVSVVAQLKLPKCRVLVPGCGRGHDAAFFAKAGHIVTAVDFSEEAIKEAQILHKDIPNLTFVCGDVFDFANTNPKAFDLVFEHTFYCAIAPTRRKSLVEMWKSVLDEHGHLLGIFFTMDKRQGPPYGSSEWELRERLKKYFHFLYWTRWHQSVPRRQGKELVVYAKKEG